MLYPFFSPLLSPIFTSFPLDFLFAGSIQHGRYTALASSLVALPASLGLLRPVSRTARGLRAPRLRRPSVPALRTALAFGGAVFRRCGRLLGVSSRLQPLRGLCLRTACARASSRFATSNGQRPGRECIFTFRTALRFACAVFRACALRVLGTPALRAFTFLQAFALQKMPEMTYTPSFLI